MLDCIFLRILLFGLNETHDPVGCSVMPFFTFNKEDTVEEWSLFLCFVLMLFTDENTRSTSALEQGRTRRACMYLHNSGNCGVPSPSLTLSREPQNSSGAMSVLSKGRQTNESLRHSESNCWSLASATTFGNLVANGTRDGNSEHEDWGSSTRNIFMVGSPNGNRFLICIASKILGHTSRSEQFLELYFALCRYFKLDTVKHEHPCTCLFDLCHPDFQHITN